MLGELKSLVKQQSPWEIKEAEVLYTIENVFREKL